MQKTENNLDIASIKKLEPLSDNEVLKIVSECHAKRRKGKKANIIDKNLLHVVLSIYNNKEFEQKQDKMVSEKFGKAKVTILNELGYEFLYCLYKLDISCDELGESWKKSITNHSEIRYQDGIIEYEFCQSRKSIHFNFLMWLRDKKYFDRNDQEIKSCDGQIKFDDFIKYRFENDNGRYEFDSYDDFKKFISISEYATVSVTSLLNLLNKENRYLDAEELFNLISNKRIFFDNGDFWSNGDCRYDINTKYLKYRPSDLGTFFATFKNVEDKKNKVTAERKKYWSYVKQKLFGNPENSERGLTQIKNLSDDMLKKIIMAIFGDTKEHRNGLITYGFLDITVDPDLDTDVDIKSYIDDLKQYKTQFLPKNATEIVDDNGQIKRISKKKIILGILLLLGISGCITAWALDLTITFFIFLAFTICSFVILFWTQIKGCFSKCCLNISNEQCDKNPICNSLLKVNAEYEPRTEKTDGPLNTY